MDFSKLSQSEKLAVYGSAAVIIGLIVASAGFFGFGLGTLALLAAIAMLVVIFLPQMSAGISLPGSKGSLMLICGGIAAAVLVLTFLSFAGFFGALIGSLNGIMFLVALVGSGVMAWAGWQEFQAEGGKFQVGTASPGSATRTSSTPGAPVPTAGTADVTDTAAPASTDPHPDPAPRADAPVDRDDEQRPTVAPEPPHASHDLPVASPPERDPEDRPPA